MKKIFVVVFVTFLLYVMTVQSQATKNPKTTPKKTPKTTPKTTPKKTPKTAPKKTPKAETPKAETPKVERPFIPESSAPNTGPGVLDFDISADVPLKSPKTGVPFSVFNWPIPKTINSDFDFRDRFTVVMSWKEGTYEFTKDRRVKFVKVVASPGGKPNPAFNIAKANDNNTKSNTSSSSASRSASSSASSTSSASDSSSTSKSKFNSPSSSSSKFSTGNHFALIILQIFIIGLYNR